MNLAVFGWYHHRNAGDDRIAQCLVRWLEGHTLAFLPAGRPAPTALLRSYDAALIGGGGLVADRGGVFRGMGRWIADAGVPVALVGVGVEATLGEELRRELRDCLDACVFAWFRDAASLAAVGPHPRAFVAPDMTWLYPFAPSPRPASGLAVCLPRAADAAAWRPTLHGLGEPLRPWPLYFENGGDGEALARALPELERPEEFTLAPAIESAAVLTARFHGLLFALQLGRPALVASDRPKARHFMAEQGLDAWRLPADRPDEVARRWRAFRERGDELAEGARALATRLHAEVWEKTEPARRRLLEAAAELPSPRRRLAARWRGLLAAGRGQA
jgi:hypothetical protein